MSKIRAQVITRTGDALARDHCVNTVYFDDFNIDPTAGTDWQAIADQTRDAFLQRQFIPGGYGAEVKVYNMADAEPRPIKATAAFAGYPQASGGSQPREVALCLSYFSERNLPRFRGRMYIGPWSNAFERPDFNQRNQLVQLAAALGAVGGPDVDWGLWSPTRNAFSKITAGWVDNEWDTVRSRGLKATTRNTFTTSE
jgi:hypothetical protein